MSSATRSVIVMTADLACAARVTGAAAAAGAVCRTAASLPALGQELAECTPAVVVVDLDLRGVAIAEIVADVRRLAPAARIIAFGPHVHAERLAVARDAGCDAVLARGEFYARASGLLRD